MLDQAGVQQFLRWDLPRTFPQQRWEDVVAGAAALFEELGLGRYAAVARSPEIQRVLGTWRFSPDEAAKAYLAAQAASGVDPPDTELLRWGSVMGTQEARARDEVARALEVAVLSGELTPRGKGWKGVAASVCDRTLTTPIQEEFGQTALDLILTERVDMWIATARPEEHGRCRDRVARRLLAPVAAPAGVESVVAPMRWLLEQASEGITLTQSNYLGKQTVLEAVDRFGWWDWDKPPRSEADVPQLGELREAATTLRLVRRQGRELSATTSGRSLLTDIDRLWHRLATTLGGRENFGQMIAELIGERLLEGTAIDDELEEALAPTVSAQGWRAGADPVTRRHVGHAIAFRLYWWRMLGLLDEERPRWENLQRIGHAKTGLTAEGEATVLAYLRHRATGPRHSLHR